MNTPRRPRFTPAHRTALAEWATVLGFLYLVAPVLWRQLAALVHALL